MQVQSLVDRALRNGAVQQVRRKVAAVRRGSRPGAPPELSGALPVLGHTVEFVRSTIDMAHNLGLRVTAEGVETPDAWNVLGALGCDQSQGYHMSRPLPADELLEWLGKSVWALGAAPRAAVPSQYSFAR